MVDSRNISQNVIKVRKKHNFLARLLFGISNANILHTECENIVILNAINGKKKSWTVGRDDSTIVVLFLKSLYTWVSLGFVHSQKKYF